MSPVVDCLSVIEEVSRNVTKLDLDLSKIIKHMECSICQEILTNPVTTSCHHSFCEACIKTVVSKTENNGCPLCKSKLKRRELNIDCLKQLLANLCKEIVTSFKTDVEQLSVLQGSSDHNHLIKKLKLTHYSPIKKVNKKIRNEREDTKKIEESIPSENVSPNKQNIFSTPHAKKNSKPLKKCNLPPKQDLKNSIQYPSPKLKNEEDKLISISQAESHSILVSPIGPEKKMINLEKISSTEKVDEWFKKTGDNCDPNNSVPSIFLESQEELELESVSQNVNKLEETAKQVVKKSTGSKEDTNLKLETPSPSDLKLKKESTMIRIDYKTKNGCLNIDNSKSEETNEDCKRVNTSLQKRKSLDPYEFVPSQHSHPPKKTQRLSRKSFNKRIPFVVSKRGSLRSGVKKEDCITASQKFEELLAETVRDSPNTRRDTKHKLYNSTDEVSENFLDLSESKIEMVPLPRKSVTRKSVRQTKTTVESEPQTNKKIDNIGLFDSPIKDFEEDVTSGSEWEEPCSSKKIISSRKRVFSKRNSKRLSKNQPRRSKRVTLNFSEIENFSKENNCNSTTKNIFNKTSATTEISLNSNKTGKANNSNCNTKNSVCGNELKTESNVVDKSYENPREEVLKNENYKVTGSTEKVIEKFETLQNTNSNNEDNIEEDNTQCVEEETSPQRIEAVNNTTLATRSPGWSRLSELKNDFKSPKRQTLKVLNVSGGDLNNSFKRNSFVSHVSKEPNSSNSDSKMDTEPIIEDTDTTLSKCKEVQNNNLGTAVLEEKVKQMEVCEKPFEASTYINDDQSCCSQQIISFNNDKSPETNIKMSDNFDKITRKEIMDIILGDLPSKIETSVVEGRNHSIEATSNSSIVLNTPWPKVENIPAKICSENNLLKGDTKVKAQRRIGYISFKLLEKTEKVKNSCTVMHLKLGTVSSRKSTRNSVVKIKFPRNFYNQCTTYTRPERSITVLKHGQQHQTPNVNVSRETQTVQNSLQEVEVQTSQELLENCNHIYKNVCHVGIQTTENGDTAIKATQTLENMLHKQVSEGSQHCKESGPERNEEKVGKAERKGSATESREGNTTLQTTTEAAIILKEIKNSSNIDKPITVSDEGEKIQTIENLEDKVQQDIICQPRVSDWEDCDGLIDVPSQNANMTDTPNNLQKLKSVTAQVKHKISENDEIQSHFSVLEQHGGSCTPDFSKKTKEGNSADANYMDSQMVNEFDKTWEKDSQNLMNNIIKRQNSIDQDNFETKKENIEDESDKTLKKNPIDKVSQSSILQYVERIQCTPENKRIKVSTEKSLLNSSEKSSSSSSVLKHKVHKEYKRICQISDDSSDNDENSHISQVTENEEKPSGKQKMPLSVQKVKPSNRKNEIEVIDLAKDKSSIGNEHLVLSDCEEDSQELLNKVFKNIEKDINQEVFLTPSQKKKNQSRNVCDSETKESIDNLKTLNSEESDNDIFVEQTPPKSSLPSNLTRNEMNLILSQWKTIPNSEFQKTIDNHDAPEENESDVLTEKFSGPSEILPTPQISHQNEADLWSQTMKRLKLSSPHNEHAIYGLNNTELVHKQSNRSIDHPFSSGQNKSNQDVKFSSEIHDVNSTKQYANSRLQSVDIIKSFIPDILPNSPVGDTILNKNSKGLPISNSLYKGSVNFTRNPQENITQRSTKQSGIGMNNSSKSSGNAKQQLVEINEESFVSPVFEKPANKQKLCLAASCVKNRSLIENFAQHFKLEYTNVPVKHMTHLVVGLHENDEGENLPLCTPKILYAMANKMWIVNEAWVEDSLLRNCILPEEAYECRDPDGGDGCKLSRLSKEPLFQHIEFCLLGDFKMISKVELESLLEDCGGTVIQDPAKFHFEDSKIRMILMDKDQLKLSENQVRDLLRKHRTVVLSHDIIVQAIQNQKLDNFTSYLLCATSEEEQLKLGYPYSLAKHEEESQWSTFRNLKS